MDIFVWNIWIPLLKLVHPCDRELFSEVDHSASVLSTNILDLSMRLSVLLFNAYPLF